MTSSVVSHSVYIAKYMDSMLTSISSRTYDVLGDAFYCVVSLLRKRHSGVGIAELKKLNWHSLLFCVFTSRLHVLCF